jgi:hypothetical protein
MAIDIDKLFRLFLSPQKSVNFTESAAWPIIFAFLSPLNIRLS